MTKSGTDSIPARVRRLGYSSYSEYLRSSHWEDVKRRYRASKLPKKCYICGDTKYELHHRTYKNMGSERLMDFVPLCRKCHGGIHQYIRDNSHKSRLNLWSATKMYKKFVDRTHS